MTTYRTATEARSALQTSASSKIESSIKTLLESKHLYQSVLVDPTELIKSVLTFMPQGNQLEALKTDFQHVATWPWQIQDMENMAERLPVPVKSTQLQHFIWSAPDIKAYCGRCKRVEPFNCDATHSLIPTEQSGFANVVDQKGLVQVFVLLYLCQSCKKVPEVFLIRRVGNRLTLSGRAPMESVQVSTVLPSPVARYVSDAQIAYQSGQVLAALFLLRTFCEQWCRPFALETDKADVAIDKYGASLPDDFKTRFPSLKAIYSDLSAAIHTATEDAPLFERTKTQIEEHFDARRLFKLHSPTSTTAK